MMARQMRCRHALAFAAAIGMVMHQSRFCSANDAEVIQLCPNLVVVPHLDGAQGSCCGLHAVHAAAAATGTDLPLDQLFEPGRFLSHANGSTVADLNRSLKSFGLSSQTISGFRSKDLAASQLPLLLLLDPFRDGSVGHWVTFLGVDGDDIRLFDSNAGAYSVPPWVLDLQWRGDGIIVGKSRSEIIWGRIRLRLFSISRRAVWLLSVMAMVWACDRAMSRLRSRRHRLIFTVAGVFILSVICWKTMDTSLAESLKLHRCLGDPVGPLAGKKVQVAPTYVREIPAGDVILVDCRQPGAFALGSIPTAINVPVDALPTLWRSRLKALIERDLTEDQPRVILYCQSALCPWASMMHERLRCVGIKSEIYSGGYERYQSNSTRRGDI